MIEVSEIALDGLLDGDPGGAVYMLNLLRFRRDGGRERYAEYARRTRQVSSRFGVEVVYYGDGEHPLVGEDGQAWDSVLIVRYPSRQAFVDMLRDPEYRAGAHLRSEALVEAVLQPTSPVS
jgi:uncharacterized protein (DUF1330 family)